ncbi:MAG: hypothetical protein JSW39_29535 [Desulfobacterales bacterium]|nr:MAG: hypothetical protein JSW39_29535 [Desulfobacterales bacterium]
MNKNQVVMPGPNKDFYTKAHLVVAAIRVGEHQKSAPPSLDQVCRLISFSMEQGNFICHKLEEMGIIEIVEGSYGTRLFIRDHLKLEEITRDENDSRLENELKKFQESQKALTKKIRTLQAEQAEKKKNLFAEMEKKLKDELEKKLGR